MKHYFLSFILLAGTALFLASCGNDEAPSTSAPAKVTRAPAVAVSTTTAKKSIPIYVYRGDRFRDPFVSLVGNGLAISGSNEEVVVPNIGGLVLKGILEEDKQKMAIISGGGITYILKDSRLYDNRQRIVKGITGAIKKNSVIMIAPDKTTKELTLRSKE